MTDPFNGTFSVTEIDSAIDVDAVILGVPFEDNSKIYIKGTSLAPNKIRETSLFFSGQSFAPQSIHELNVLDLGNLEVEGSYEQVTSKLAEQVRKIIEKDSIPVIIGGDHSIALGTAQGIRESKVKFDAVVWIDAHVDLMDSYPEDEKFTRATVLRRIMELDYFNTKNYYFIGCRGHNLGLEEVKLIKDKGMTKIEAQEFSNVKSIEKKLSEIATKHNSLYVSLDIDVLDPAFAPGVSVPEPGGLSTRELISIIRLLAKKIKCFELVEVNPTKDINDFTSLVACKIIFELMDAKA